MVRNWVCHVRVRTYRSSSGPVSTIPRPGVNRIARREFIYVGGTPAGLWPNNDGDGEQRQRAALTTWPRRLCREIPTCHRCGLSQNRTFPRATARLRHRRFFSLAELNQATRELVDQLNDRPMRGWGTIRRALYEQIDRPALRELPPAPYEYADRKRCRVNLDYHVEIAKHFCSVPFRPEPAAVFGAGGHHGRTGGRRPCSDPDRTP